MFYVVLYFIVAYILVALLIGAVGCMSNVRRMASKGRFTLIIALMLLPFIPYITVAYLTRLYAAELIPYTKKATESLWGDSDFRIVRVLDISATNARVYVTTPCSEGVTGDVITLTRTATGWQLQNNGWNTVFSDCGSAEGNTFPPYPEARGF